ncbi:MAG: MaoC family dehydratase [Alphaproteobacteria bacterium]|jgi:acyl dehydratase|nr:MaoC family dehydratase [Alphaproteobacteria bacterium]
MGLAFDDIEQGREYPTFSRTVTEADHSLFIGFARMTLPIFNDETYARTTAIGSRIAPGFMTCSIVAGMMESVLGRSTLAGLGMDEMRFPNPVRIGDTIRARILVAEKRSLSDGQRGMVTLQIKTLNQRDEIVLQFVAKVMLSLKEPPLA